jgi:hypothetical protein
MTLVIRVFKKDEVSQLDDADSIKIITNALLSGFTVVDPPKNENNILFAHWSNLAGDFDITVQEAD